MPLRDYWWCILVAKYGTFLFTEIGVVLFTDYIVLDHILIDFISDFNLSSFQTWNLICIHPNHQSEITNYRLFYKCNPSDDKVVDYNSSKFFMGKNADWKFRGNSISLRNQDEYRMKYEEIMNYRLIKCEELVLNFTNISEDLIRLSNNPIATGYLISERLKNALESNQFSGMEFIPVQSRDKRIVVVP